MSTPVEVAVEVEVATCRNCGTPVFMIDERWLHRAGAPVRPCPGTVNEAAPNLSTRRDAIVYIQLPEDAVATVVGKALDERDKL